MIETYGLTKAFSVSGGAPFTAVQGVDLHVAPGEVLALLGPNGAGKTTTVRMLAAILQPTRVRRALPALMSWWTRSRYGGERAC